MPANRPAHSTSWLTDTPPSRASLAPTGMCAVPGPSQSSACSAHTGSIAPPSPAASQDQTGTRAAHKTRVNPDDRTATPAPSHPAPPLPSTAPQSPDPDTPDQQTTRSTNAHPPPVASTTLQQFPHVAPPTIARHARLSSRIGGCGKTCSSTTRETRRAGCIGYRAWVLTVGRFRGDYKRTRASG